MEQPVTVINTMAAPPLVSVILSVYNGAQTLHRTLKSIQTQTHSTLEIVAINDASTDNTQEILEQWHTKNSTIPLTIIRNETNLGLTKSLNKGIQHAQGTYLARIDADDWWEPTKLEQQLAWSERYTNYGVVGTWYTNHRKSKTRNVQLPVTDEDIRTSIFRRNPFGHSCVLMRKTIIERAGGYDERLSVGQDLDLWFRMLPLTKYYNVPEYLCHRTINEKLNKREQMRNHIATTMHYIKRYKASPKNYLYLVEPFLVMMLPRWIRKLR